MRITVRVPVLISFDVPGVGATPKNRSLAVAKVHREFEKVIAKADVGHSDYAISIDGSADIIKGPSSIEGWTLLGSVY